jgi:hypothetical protein
MAILTADGASQHSFEIPKECNAGVVFNEGPDFYVEVKKVPVPEIGTVYSSILRGTPSDIFRLQGPMTA